jgi:polyphosphate kinase 2 (PPK2 family)
MIFNLEIHQNWQDYANALKQQVVPKHESFRPWQLVQSQMHK